MNCPTMRDLRDGYCPVTGRPRSGLKGTYRHLLPLVDRSTDRDRWINAVYLDMDKRGAWDRMRAR